MTKNQKLKRALKELTAAAVPFTKGQGLLVQRLEKAVVEAKKLQDRLI